MSALPLRLAWRQLGHDWQASLCFIAALIGVMAPLLVILGLKNGVISGLVDRLVENPSNRELIAVGAGQHDAAFFAALAQRPDVGFVVPATRSINGLANGVRNPASRRLERAVTILPSGPGDPLTDGPPVAPGAVHATQSLLTALEAAPGDEIEIIIGRDIDGARETARGRLRILAAVPEDRFARPALFLSLPDLVAVEAFRDDPAITPETWREARPAPEHYASFRIYAAGLSDLAGLERALVEQGVQVRPRAENVTLLLGFRRNLNALYGVIATLAIAGFWAAMAANLRGMVERQRQTYSLLRLLGLGGGARRMIPVVEAGTLVALGTGATLALVLPALAAINLAFETPTGAFVARLGLGDILATLAIAALTAATASVWALRAISDIQSDEVLYHA